MSVSHLGTPIPVILASASPRRRELLTLIGIPHTVSPADIDESVLDGETPDIHAERLARSKAAAIAHDAAGSLVIAADTIVVIDGDILGKPKTPDDAIAMIRRLSGKTHTVVTAIACAYNDTIVSDTERVEVTFRDLSDKEIRDYVATGEPMDKAGAYGIQGFGATIVRRIDGDYFAVMGLSLVTLVQLLAKLGIHYRFNQAPLTQLA